MKRKGKKKKYFYLKIVIFYFFKKKNSLFRELYTPLNTQYGYTEPLCHCENCDIYNKCKYKQLTYKDGNILYFLRMSLLSNYRKKVKIRQSKINNALNQNNGSGCTLHVVEYFCFTA